MQKRKRRIKGNAWLILLVLKKIPRKTYKVSCWSHKAECIIHFFLRNPVPRLTESMRPGKEWEIRQTKQKKSKVLRRPTRSANQTKYPKEVPIIWKKYLQLHIKFPTKSIQNHCTALIYIYNTRIKSISQFPKSEIEIAISIQSLTKTRKS